MKVDLISDRYLNDSNSLVSLNLIQENVLDKFLADPNIHYSKIPSCPLCGFHDFTLIAEKERYGIPLNTVVCEKCGLIFSHPIMDIESSFIFYKDYYRKIYEGKTEDISQQLAKKYEERSKGNLPKFLKKNDVVVEIGTGGGWNLLKFKNHGLVHYGFDYNEDYINYGKENYNLNLIMGGIEEASALNVKANYLLLLEVLEHTTNPIIFLQDLKKILSENAIIYVKVPSAHCLPWLGGGDIGYDLLGTLQIAHNFLFDDFTLKYLFLKCGFTIVSIVGGNCIIKNTNKDDGEFAEIDNFLNENKRGNKVIKYLKTSECLIKLKSKLFPRPIIRKLYPVFYLTKPISLTKAIALYRFGINI